MIRIVYLSLSEKHSNKYVSNGMTLMISTTPVLGSTFSFSSFSSLALLVDELREAETEADAKEEEGEERRGEGSNLTTEYISGVSP